MTDQRLPAGDPYAVWPGDDCDCDGCEAEAAERFRREFPEFFDLGGES